MSSTRGRATLPSVAQQIHSSNMHRAIGAQNNAAYPGDVHSMKDHRSVYRPTVPDMSGMGSRGAGSAMSRLFRFKRGSEA